MLMAIFFICSDIDTKSHGFTMRLTDLKIGKTLRQTRESLTDAKKFSCRKECLIFSPLCFGYRFLFTLK